MTKPSAVIRIVQEYETNGDGALSVRVYFTPPFDGETDTKSLPMSHIAAMLAVVAIDNGIGDGSPLEYKTGGPIEI